MNSIPCTVENGKLVYNPTSMYLFCQKNEGNKCDVMVRKSRRTISQNRYLHRLFQYIADETGQEKNDVKTIEKRRHLTPKERTLFGKTHLILPSTTSLNKQEMSEFIEKVEADCAFLGIILPTREELEAMGYIFT